MKALLNDTVIAESQDTIVVEGNHYFPKNTLKEKFFKASEHTTVCGWKGKASYYDVQVGDVEAKNAAWYYPTPKDAAAEVKDRVAFWGAVKVVEG